MVVTHVANWLGESVTNQGQ